MRVAKPILETKLKKVVPVYNEKGKKFELLLEVTFQESDPLHFSYSLLDRWIKGTLVDKAILPEEAAELLYAKLFEIMKEKNQDFPFQIHVATLKAEKHLNVEVTMTYAK